MASPVQFNKPFKLPKTRTNKFYALGAQKGNRGTTHTAFLNKVPFNPNFFVGDPHSLSGYCSYRVLYNDNTSLIIGVLFLSLSSQTVVSDYSVQIGTNSSELLDKFEPSFILENLGILVFKAQDSSLLIIPSSIDLKMLVKAD